MLEIGTTAFDNKVIRISDRYHGWRCMQHVCCVQCYP